MSPSIVIRLALAALATAFVLPAQSAPLTTKPKEPAQTEAKADEKVQTRLAEVIAMLEEDDLTPEQRAEAKKKLKEIGARLKQEAAKAQAGGAWTLRAPKITTSADGHVIVESKEGVYLVAPDSKPAEVREVEGFPAVDVYRRYPDAGAKEPSPPPVPDLAPSPARAPKAPRAPRAPRAPSPESAPAAPEAPDTTPGAWRVVPEAGQAGPTPPRAVRTRITKAREVPIETVQESAVEVDLPVKVSWARAKAAEEARAEAMEVEEVVRVRGRVLGETRDKLEEARARQHGEHGQHGEQGEYVRARHDAARAKADADRLLVEAHRYHAKADEARRDAEGVRERFIEVVRGEQSPARHTLRLDDEAKAKKGGNVLFGRVVESRPAEAGDDEIRALIDEMRAEMRQIRALMQELRTRSDRDEEADESVGSGQGSGGATSVSGFYLGGQATAPAPAASEQRKAVRVRAPRNGATNGSGQASGSGSSSGSGQSQGSSSSATSFGGR